MLLRDTVRIDKFVLPSVFMISLWLAVSAIIYRLYHDKTLRTLHGTMDASSIRHSHVFELHFRKFRHNLLHEVNI